MIFPVGLGPRVERKPQFVCRHLPCGAGISPAFLSRARRQAAPRACAADSREGRGSTPPITRWPTLWPARFRWCRRAPGRITGGARRPTTSSAPAGWFSTLIPTCRCPARALSRGAGRQIGLNAGPDQIPRQQRLPGVEGGRRPAGLAAGPVGGSRKSAGRVPSSSSRRSSALQWSTHHSSPPRKVETPSRKSRPGRCPADRPPCPPPAGEPPPRPSVPASGG